MFIFIFVIFAYKNICIYIYFNQCHLFFLGDRRKPFATNLFRPWVQCVSVHFTSCNTYNKYFKTRGLGQLFLLRIMTLCTGGECHKSNVFLVVNVTDDCVMQHVIPRGAERCDLLAVAWRARHCLWTGGRKGKSTTQSAPPLCYVFWLVVQQDSRQTGSV